MKNLNVVVADSISNVGGTRSFLETLLFIHHKNNLPTLLVLQNSNADVRIRSICNRFNIELLIVKDRRKIFKKSYLCVFYEFYVYKNILNVCNPNLILATIGTPRLFLSFFLFARVPFIYYLHTMPMSPGKISKLMDLFARLTSKEKRFVTVSNASSSYITKYMGVDNRYVDVIYNSVDVHKKLESSLNLPIIKSDEVIVVTVGHVVAYKNPFLWIQVARRTIEKSPNVKFYWVGDGALLNHMRSLVDKYGLKESIFFVGAKTNMVEIYAEANIYFHPSRLESHGISIVEAMMSGLPVVASNVGGIPESVIDNITGFIHDVDDIESYVNTIIHLSIDKEHAAAMGVAGLLHASEKFSIQSQESSVLRLYKMLSVI